MMAAIGLVSKRLFLLINVMEMMKWTEIVL